jgi:Na+/H+ antiporter NhaD/arsenite permease-like protein
MVLLVAVQSHWLNSDSVVVLLIAIVLRIVDRNKVTNDFSKRKTEER